LTCYTQWQTELHFFNHTLWSRHPTNNISVLVMSREQRRLQLLQFQSHNQSCKCRAAIFLISVWLARVIYRTHRPI